MNRPTNAPPAWATDASYDAPGEPYDGQDTKVEPDSGRKAIGHEPTKRPPAEQFNWWQNLAYTWLLWLADLVLSPATKSAMTVDVNAAGGTFTRSAGNFITDGFAVGQRVNWTGFTNGGNNVSRRLITGLTATVMTFADTSGLVNESGNGNEAATAWITFGGRAHFDLSAYFEGDVEVNDDVVIDGELHVLGETTLDSALNLGGPLYHVDRTLTLSPLGGAQFQGGTIPDPSIGAVVTAGVGDGAFLQIPLQVGDRIKSVTWARKGNGATQATITVHKYDSAGGSTNIGSVTQTPSASWGTTTIDVTDTTLAAGESLAITVVADNANYYFGSVSVTYDRP